jgi:hypothetical protein
VELAICASLAELYKPDSKRHTLNVILGVRLTCFIVVDQSDDVEQIVLAQLLQAIRELLHIHSLVPPVLLLARVLAAHTVRVAGRA